MKDQLSRAQIIQSVRTPLGVFVVAVFAIETILGLTAGFSEGTSRTILILGMIGNFTLLILIVAGMAWFRQEALLGPSPPPASDAFPEVEHVADPSILCASSQHFDAGLGGEMGFEGDVEAIVASFPVGVLVERNIDLKRFRDRMTDKEFQIVHLMTRVDPKDGSLLFEGPEGPHDERLSLDGFCELVEVCKARLVVLATCDSLLLAAGLVRLTNVIAATKDAPVEALVAWEEVFYRMLSKGESVSRAFHVARETTNAPVSLSLQRDVTFSKAQHSEQTGAV